MHVGMHESTCKVILKFKFKSTQHSTSLRVILVKNYGHVSIHVYMHLEFKGLKYLRTKIPFPVMSLESDN